MVFTIVIVLIVAGGLTEMFWHLKMSVWSFTQDTITIASLGIAIVALGVALITYLSIDSVNAINSMEGNVLENSNYSIASAELISEYEMLDNQEKFTNKLLDDMTEFLEENHLTCMEYADSIQYIIDRLVWCAYMNHTDKTFKEKKETLLNSLDNISKKHNKISNGIQYTFNEHVKLIRYILEYQDNIIRSNYNICKIVNVRGRMIQNAIARTVYYDYLGLTYFKQAEKFISETFACDWKFLLENTFVLTNIKDDIFQDEEQEKVKLLLNLSEDALNEAEKHIEGDVLWEGYVKYNLVRIYVVRFLFWPDDVKKDKLKDKLKEVVAIRRQVCSLYVNHEGYLKQRLQDEIEYAEGLYRIVLPLLKQ